MWKCEKVCLFYVLQHKTEHTYCGNKNKLLLLRRLLFCLTLDFYFRKTHSIYFILTFKIILYYEDTYF